MAALNHPVLRRAIACALAILVLAAAWVLVRPATERRIDCVVTFPALKPGAVEPLLVTGHSYDSDRLEVRGVEGGRIQIFWDSYGLGGPSSGALTLPANRTALLSIDAPSLYGRLERRMLEDEPDDLLVVELDGRAVLSGRVAFFRSAAINRHLGVDTAFATTPGTEKRFTGSLSVRPAAATRVPLRKLPWAIAHTLVSAAASWLALGWLAFAITDTVASRRNQGTALRGDARMLSGIALAATIVTFFIGSAGQPFAVGRTYDGYPEGYAMMTHAFAQGQLALLQKPSPALLALPNPYDSRQNAGLRLHDAILYHERYYFYLSPLPAVLLNLPVLWLTGTDVPQALAVTLWTALGTVALLGALLEAKRRWHPELPHWALGALAVSFAFAAPVLYLVGRPTMYEQPVAAAYAFLGIGLFALVKAWRLQGSEQRGAGSENGASEGQRPAAGNLSSGIQYPNSEVRAPRSAQGLSWPMVSACGFALAAACRPNIALACPGLGLMWLVLAKRKAKGTEAASSPRSAVFLRAFLLCLPFLAVGVGLGYLNWKRFGAPLDFGWRWQLWGRPELASQATNFSVRNIAPNLQQYLYGPPRFSSEFPFVEANARKVYFRSPYTIGAEPLVGIAWALPLQSLALAWWAALLRKRRLADAASPDLWIGLLLTAGAGVMLFNHLYSAFAMRYMPDFLPFVEMAGALAFMGWASEATSRGRRTALAAVSVAVALVVAAASVGMALKAGDLGFAWRNPELFGRLASLF